MDNAVYELKTVEDVGEYFSNKYDDEEVSFKFLMVNPELGILDNIHEIANDYGYFIENTDIDVKDGSILFEVVKK